MYSLQNLCVAAAHRPIKEILEKEKKVNKFSMFIHDFVMFIICCIKISCIGQLI